MVVFFGVPASALGAELPVEPASAAEAISGAVDRAATTARTAKLSFI